MNVGPKIQVGACGNGLGVLGQGTSTQSCQGQSTNLGVGDPDSEALLNVSPDIQVGVCGNGAGRRSAASARKATARVSRATSSAGTAA